MKIIATLFALFLSVSLFAQQETTWIGGTFGQEDAWDQPSNWSTGQVPDEDSRVIIQFRNSGHHAQPVITSDVQVAAIEIQSLGHLTIEESGHLIVDGSENYSEGIQIYGGSVENYGVINLQDMAIHPSVEILTQITDGGKVFLNSNLQPNWDQPHMLTAK